MVFSDKRGRWGRHGHGEPRQGDEFRMDGGRDGHGRDRRHGRGSDRAFPFGGDPRGDRMFGPGGPFGRGALFGHGPKVGRGDVRSAILRLLAEEPRNGYQIIQELTERSGGVWKPSPGSVYPALQQLEDEGLIQAEERDGKKVFRLTPHGEGAAKAQSESAAPWDTASDGFDRAVGERAMDVRMLIGQVATAMAQVVQAGNESQIARAQEVMANTRRSLYRILAEDDIEPTKTEQ